MKKVLVAGSIAYDKLFNFSGSFKEVLNKEDLSNLSISFSANSHEVFFGGCGGNIAFSLKMFGIEPQLVGVAGNDFANYQKWLEKNDISCSHIFIDHNSPTALANILSDIRGNQIAFFAPGAMGCLIDKNLIDEDDLRGIDLAIVSPDLPSRMLWVAKFLGERKIPYIFDPGQALSALERRDISSMLENAIGVIVNEYESKLMLGKLNLKESEIFKLSPFYVKTAGGEGCYLYCNEKMINVSAVSAEVVDPTGCGDCFRAGFIYGYLNDPEDLVSACKMGSVAASFALKERGTQNHSFNLRQLENRLKNLKEHF